jgi:hypothetical protein
MPPYLPVVDAPRRMRDFLNGRARLDDASKGELRMLINAWLTVGADWQRFVETMLKAGQPFPCEGRFFIPAGLPRPVLVPVPVPGSTHAQGVFLQFILHPESENLGGPCARCRKYFLKKTRHQKVYCSRSCVAFATATKATRRSRDAHHAQLLQWASDAVAEWERTKTRITWKVWTVKRFSTTHKPTITEKSLTRWVNTGELKPPGERTGTA